MYHVALSAVFRKNALTTRSYWLNSVASIVSHYVLFALMFYGSKNLAGGIPGLGSGLEGVFISYIVWMLALAGCYDLAFNIGQEAEAGTLEQLYLSPVGFKWLAFFTQLFNFCVNISSVTLTTSLVVLTTKQQVHFDFLSVFPLIIATYLQAVSLGYALGGLALIYKRIQALFQVVQYVLVAFIVTSQETFRAAKYLPFNQARVLLQRVMVDGTRISGIATEDLLVLLFVTAAWFIVGLGFYSMAESRARRGGLLGHY